METTPSSSLTRYRPIVLALTGFAACYGAFIVYKSIQETSPPPPPASGIHRSNAVHRARRPARPSRLQSQHDGNATAPPQQPTDPAVTWNTTVDYGRMQIIGSNGAMYEIELQPSNFPTLQSLQEEQNMDEEMAREALPTIHRQFVSRFLIAQVQHSGDGVNLQQELLGATAWLETLGISGHTYSEGLRQIVHEAEREATARQHGTRRDSDDTDTIAGTEIDLSFPGNRGNGVHLKQLLYHIAESQARVSGFVHRGVRCDSCGTSPIRGIRWKCANCVELDLCSDCHDTCMHARNHIFYEIKIPTHAMSHLHPVMELSYPGRLDVSKAPVMSATFIKDLVEQSEMEKAELEGLYEQFVCLAKQTLESEPQMWAIDRATFPYIISPLSSRAPLRMNLIGDRLFNLFDANHDNVIDFEEFVMGIVFLRSRSSRKNRWKKTFEAYDIDGDGYITRADCLRMFRALYSIQRDIALDLISTNALTNGLRDASTFAQGSRVLSAAFAQNPRTVPEPRAPLRKTKNSYGDVRHQPGQDVVKENGSLEGNKDEIIGHAWESQAQFPFDHRTGEPLSMRDFLYLAPRDQSGAAPTQIARDQRVQFTYNGASLSEARKRAVQERNSRAKYYHADDPYVVMDAPDIPGIPKDHTKEIAYQVLEEALNELLDPLFKAKEDYHMQALSARPDIERWKVEIDAFEKAQHEAEERAQRAARDPLMVTAAAAEDAAMREQEEQQRKKEQDTWIVPRENGTANGHARRSTRLADVIEQVEAQVQAQPLETLLESEGFSVRDEAAPQLSPSDTMTDGETSIDNLQEREQTATHLDISSVSRPDPLSGAERGSLRLVPGVSPISAAAEGASGTPLTRARSNLPITQSHQPQPHIDPTMPQFRPNSERDIIESLPRDITIDPLLRPATPPSQDDTTNPKRVKNEAEIIRQFEYMFLGWTRDPVTGVVLNSTTATTLAREAQNSKTGVEELHGREQQESGPAPSEDRLQKLAELRRYLEGNVFVQKDMGPGLKLEEFETFLDGGGGRFKFLEGWLEVCFL